MELRRYQIDIANQASKKVKEYGFCYIAAEVRTGKTLMALKTAELLGCKSVLFLTKKKAIKSIETDYANFGFQYKLTVVNWENLHNVKDKFDLIICDEAHTMGGFPKIPQRVNQLRIKYYDVPKILLSGTPHPESYSQIFHQLYVCPGNPFIGMSFYQWAKIYVNVQSVNYGYGSINNYKLCYKDKLLPVIDKYFIRWSQKESGFESKIEEEVLYVMMDDQTYDIANELTRNNVVELLDADILGDTGVKLMGKLHQIYSGTVITEQGEGIILDTSKADFIKQYFKGKKIGIFYKFRTEYDMIKKVFGDMITDDLNEFDTTDKCIALQMVSGREGISLRNAEYLVFLNIDFSAVTYFQARDRMTTKERRYNKIFWIFAKDGIEGKIYNAVSNKKNYTTSLFKKQYVVSL
jgi:hypothetical protein